MYNLTTLSWYYLWSDVQKPPSIDNNYNDTKLRIQYFPYFGLRVERRCEIVSNCESNKSGGDECERLSL